MAELVRVDNYLNETEKVAAKAIDNAEKVLDNMTKSLAQSSLGGADVTTITVGSSSGTLTFAADSAGASFVVGQVANRVTQQIGTLTTAATKTDEVGKTVSQKT